MNLINKDISQKISHYLKNKKYDLRSVKDGKNNKIFFIKSKNKNYVLKIYLSKNYKFLINREKTFYEFLKKRRVKNISKIEAYGKNFILFNKINGKKFNLIKKKHFYHIEKFILSLKENKISYRYFAKEDGYSLKNYILNTDQKFKEVSKKLTKLNDKQLSKLIKSIRENWERVKNFIIRDKNICLTKIISPSDFGIHNMLTNKDFKIYFYDFEYAGKDSLEKMICDLISNPNNRQNFKFFEKLINKIEKRLLLNYSLFQNCKKLININYIRWSLIVIGSLVGEKKKQRISAGINENLRSQVLKSYRLLDKIKLN